RFGKACLCSSLQRSLTLPGIAFTTLNKLRRGGPSLRDLHRKSGAAQRSKSQYAETGVNCRAVMFEAERFGEPQRVCVYCQGAILKDEVALKCMRRESIDDRGGVALSAVLRVSDDTNMSDASPPNFIIRHCAEGPI